jgi:hypothetical protein
MSSSGRCKLFALGWNWNRKLYDLHASIFVPMFRDFFLAINPMAA